MRRTHLVLIFCVLIPVYAAANAGSAALLAELEAALQIDDSYDIAYEFRFAHDALGQEGKGAHELRMLRREGKDYLFADLESPVKIYFAEQQFCRMANAEWQCELVPAEVLAAQMRRKQMSMHPLSSAYLLHQAVRDYPKAIAAAATGEHYVAGRLCSGYQVIVDPTKMPRSALNKSLHVGVDSEQTIPFVTGINLSLCFDVLSGHLLEYQSQLVLDHAGMRQAGYGGSAVSSEYGAILGGFTATRYNAFPPSDAAFYAVPKP